MWEALINSPISAASNGVVHAEHSDVSLSAPVLHGEELGVEAAQLSHALTASPLERIGWRGSVPRFTTRSFGRKLSRAWMIVTVVGINNGTRRSATLRCS